MAHCQEPKNPKQSAHGHCQKPEASRVPSYFMADTPEQAAHLISSHLITSHGVMALAFIIMAGLNKIMKDDEII
jgi:hypothetical protein